MSNRSWFVVASTVIFGTVLAMFVDVLFTNEAVVLSKQGLDLFDQFAYWRAFGFSQLRQGNLALWNPHVFSGMPFLGGFQSALLYPLNFPYLFLSVAKATNVSIALHVLLIGIFMYLWTSNRGLHPLACLVSSALLMFGGAFFMHIHVGHLPHLCTMTWAPLVFLSIDRLFENRSVGWCLLGMFAVTMQILAGYPQHLFYTAVAAALYCSLCGVKARRWALLALGLVSVYVGAAALGAVQLLAGIDVAEQSVRSGGLSLEFASKFSFPPENLLTLLAPGFFGNNMTFPYWGRWYVWEVTFFVGVTGLFLAVYGSAYGDRTLRRFSVSMALLLTLLALGAYTPLFRILHACVPGFDRFRGTSKFIFQASLFITMLAGIGVDHMLRSRHIPRKVILVTIVAGVSIGTLALCIDSSAKGSSPTGWWQQTLGALHATHEYYIPEKAYVDPSFLKDAGVVASKSLIISSGTLLLLALLSYGVKFSRGGVYAIVFLSIIESFLFAKASRATFDYNMIREPDLEQFLTNHPGDYRILNPSCPNYSMLTGTQDIWGYDSVVLRRYAEFVTFTQGDSPEHATQYVQFSRFHPLYTMLRCRYAFLPEGQEVRVIESESVMPRVQLVQNYLIVPGRDQILALMEDVAFDPSQTVILEAAPDPKPITSSKKGTARVVQASTDDLIIEADLPHPAILLITDPYCDGWQARPLPGSIQAEYEVVPANYVLRAIPLSGGHHRIRVEYLPLGFQVGKWISIISVIIYTCMLGRCYHKVRIGNLDHSRHCS